MDVAAIKKRLEKITPGEWTAGENYLIGGYWVVSDKHNPEKSEVADFIKQSNADFIAHAPADIRALLAEIERLQNRTPKDTYNCQRCGVKDGLDASLPRVQWEAVAGEEWATLCLWCIDALATEKGIQAAAHLYFNGISIKSALYG